VVHALRIKILKLWEILFIFILFITNLVFVSAATDYDEVIDDEWSMENNHEIIDNNTLLNTNLIIGSEQKLSVIDSIIYGNSTSNSSPRFEIEAGGTFTMLRSKLINFGFDRMNPGLVIQSSNIIIKDSNFTNNFIGLTLDNISNAIIERSIFSQNSIGILLKNCNNITFIDCKFVNNSDLSLDLISSGQKTVINIINCSILSPESDDVNTTVQLNNSKLEFINVTYQHNIADIVSLDNKSELHINWYLNLALIDDNNQQISSVHVLIFDQTFNLIYEGKTNKSGKIFWILIKEQILESSDRITMFTPITIQADKKGYSEKDENISERSINSEPFTIILKKDKESSDDSFTETIFLICTCMVVVIIVFIILIAVNVQIMKRKLGPKGLNALYPQMNKNKQMGTDGKDLIACSECGAQISDDVAFCPHCGEYFEGEEFTCPGCNAIVHENDRSCPKCGRIFVDGTDEMDEDDTKQDQGSEKKKQLKKHKEKRFCSECGAVVMDAEERCPACGLLFDSEDTPTQFEERVNRTRKRITQTARKITGDEETELEIKEKQKLEDVTDIGDDSYICSMCGTSISEELTKCPKCGTEFE
jgi:parallel beta-helix repeat protein